LLKKLKHKIKYLKQLIDINLAKDKMTIKNHKLSQYEYQWNYLYKKNFHKKTMKTKE